MPKHYLLKPLFFWILILLCCIGYGQNKSANPNASYQPPVFTDAARLQKLETWFPLVAKIYNDYAEKNHFPGYAFGIVLDGKLVAMRILQRKYQPLPNPCSASLQ